MKIALSPLEKFRAAGKFLDCTFNKRPLTVSIEVTKRCNARCDFCDYWKITDRDELTDFTDVVRRPALPDSALERVRSERLMELLQQREEPAAIAGKRFSNLLYGAGTYGNSIIGNPGSVSRLTIDDVRRFYQQNFVPNNTAMIIAGDVVASRVVADIARLFGDWKRAAAPENDTRCP